MKDMDEKAKAAWAPTLLVLVLSASWLAALVFTGPGTAQTVSNIGLTLVAMAAGAAAVWRSRRTTLTARFWLLFGIAVLSWSFGQTAWTVYESILGREVPFPSVADVGYLGLPIFAAAALLSIPLAKQSLAGRLRTLIDGMMVASSVLLCSWILVLRPVYEAGGEGWLSQGISLAYPIGDIVVITIVIYTWLRARHVRRRPPVPLALLGTGLLAFAFSDSAFMYLTTTDLYSSGNVIDVGWFAGFVLMLLAAMRAGSSESDEEDSAFQSRPLGNLLPYAAVIAALVTSSVEVWRTGHGDMVVMWTRTWLMFLLVARQLLTLSENHALTRDLEHRVLSRTAELSASRERFAALVQHSSDVVTVLDASRCVTYQSASIERVLGHDAADVVGRPIYELFDATASAELASALEHAASEPMRIHTLATTWPHADGRRCHVETTITNLLENPHVQGLVLNTRDVTERFLLEQQLTQQAFTDALTGLPNRALFKDRLQHALDRGARDEESLAVLFLDLDGFKAVNDTLGHSAGDELLVQVAERMRTVVRPSDTVARFGGDEFAVLIEASALDDETAMAQRINEAIAEPFEVGNERVHVAASVGIAKAAGGERTAEQLLRNADLAMYQAKGNRDGGFAVFHPTMHAGLVERVRLESDLRTAVAEQQFVVHFQPMISMASGEITGVEALVRWQHPERGLVSPLDFIPLAEATGLIVPLGLFVLRHACARTVDWEHTLSGAPKLQVSVNVSPRQLLTGTFADDVVQVLQETGLPATRLTLEMTENVLIDNQDETLATLNTLRAMGVKLAIDDFGTGYSSLSYLHRFPVDVLKIDRSFIERLNSGEDAGLVGAILRLGQTMHLETVAEGIERPQQMLFLRRQGCTTGQGFHFSPPVREEELRALLVEQSEEPASTLTTPA